MSEPVKWVDGLGRAWWQPQSSDGRELYLSWYGSRVWRYFCPDNGAPKRYRSKKRAERIGRRRSKYLSRVALTLTRIEREQTDD